MADKPYQRKGSSSNSKVGQVFEKKTQSYFDSEGYNLQTNIDINVGINGKKKHKFDLVDEKNNLLVECKSHKWTEGENVPSAKMTTWNETMYYFFSAPTKYRKILFVLKHYSRKRKKTLAEYYIERFEHLIPKGTEIWEYDEHTKKAMPLYMH